MAKYVHLHTSSCTCRHVPFIIPKNQLTPPKKRRYLQVPMKIPSLANEDAFVGHRRRLR